MAYDPTSRSVVYFGGGWNLGASGGDTWTFTNFTWLNITASLTVSPGPREAGLMTYDAADGYVLLFGGYTTGGGPNGSGAHTLNDTWKFQSGAWTNISSQSPVVPPSRLLGAMAYDYHDGYAVLFGGMDPRTTLKNDTWTFHAGVWTNISASAGVAPAARDYAAIADDPADGYLLLFGGWNSTSWTVYNDSWSFSNGTWKQLAVPVHPAPLRGAMMAYDSLHHQLVLFGGATMGFGGPYHLRSETWSFSGGAWTNITRTISSAPPARFSAGFSNLSSSGSLLMADGCLGQGCANYLTISDTWIFNASGPVGRAWISLGTTAQPSGRTSPAMAYDPTGHYVVYFGGGWNFGAGGNDTWTFANSTWTNISANLSRAPSQREAAVMAYDAQDSYLVLFGGYTDGGSHGAYSYTLNDTWKFQAGAWTNITSLSPQAPPARFVSAMTYDYTDGYVVLFGGFDLKIGGPMNDTWTFSAGVWTNVTATAGHAPPARDYAALTDDPSDGYVVLFGGWDGVQQVIFNDTWTFAHGSWAHLVTHVAPVPLRGAMVAYEAIGHYVLLFGGFTYSSPGEPYGLVTQTWKFAAGNWTNLTPFITAEPPARFSPGMMNISNSGTILMADGCLGQGCFPNEVLSDTWLYNWTNVNGTFGGGSGNGSGHQPVLPPGSVNRSTTFVVHAVGGSWAYHYTFSGLPNGCASANSSRLVCDPLSGGNYTIVATVTDSSGRSLNLSLNWSIPATSRSLTVVSSVRALDVGQSVVLSAAASGGAGAPWSYQYSGLPANCTSASVSTLDCRPSLPGAYRVVVAATDRQGGRVSSTVSFVVFASVQAALQTSPTVIDLTESFTATAQPSFGSSAYTYAWSNLPAGCMTEATTVSVQCTPTAVGTSSMSLRVTDSLGQSAFAGPTVLQVNALPQIRATAVNDSARGAPLTVELTANLTGGTGPYSVAWVFGDGVGGSSAIVTHTYATSGTYTPTVWVNDSRGFGASYSLSLTVHPLGKGPPQPLPNSPAKMAWYASSLTQFGLGLLASVVLGAVVATWAVRRRRAMDEGNRLVEAVSASAQPGAAQSLNGDGPSLLRER